MRDVEAVEPEAAELCEDAAFVGNAAGEDPVEGADAVGAYQEQAIAEVVDVADFAAADGECVERGFEDGGGHVCIQALVVMG